MTPLFIRGALGAAALLAAISASSAHVTFETAQVSPNTTQKFVARVPHGCDGQATNVVRITVPEGLIDVKPMPKAGWTLDTRVGAYAGTYQLHGKAVSSGVREIVWSGGHLADGHYDEFVFRARVTDTLAGKQVPVPVVQECATGKAAWTEVAAPGQDAHALKFPAPIVTVAAAQGAAPATATTVRAGSLTLIEPWSVATPGGARVAGGYLAIVNDGTVADRLVGGTFEQGGRVEIHEMSNANGIMRMRELDKGLEIGPKARSELKPGGYHIMFTDLKRPLVAGERIPAVLRFEKAGDVTVEFVVRPLGANAGGHSGGGHSHH